MSLMSVSQYAKHAGLSRQALYNWEAKQGFPARVDGKIDQEVCDAYLARYRSASDPRTKNARGNRKPTRAGGAGECAGGNECRGDQAHHGIR